MPNHSRRSRFSRGHAPSFTLTDGDPDAAGPGHRTARLEHLIRDTLQSSIRDDAADPALEGVVVLAVHLSVDSSHARIAYAVHAPLAEEAQRRRESLQGLERASGFLRAQLAQHLSLKKLPRLGFTFVGVTDSGAA